MVKCLRDEHAGDIACTLIIPEWATWIAGRRYLREIGGDALPVASRRAARSRRFDLLWFPFNGPSWDDFRGPSVATLHDALNFELPGFSGIRRHVRAQRSFGAYYAERNEFAQHIRGLLHVL